MSDIQNDLPETVIECLLEIETVATSTDGEADKSASALSRWRIVPSA